MKRAIAKAARAKRAIAKAACAKRAMNHLFR